MGSDLQTSKPLITKISYNSPIATSTNYDLEDGKWQKTKGEKILWIDLDWEERHPAAGANASGIRPLIYEEELLEHMRQAVVLDMRQDPPDRIDTVRFNVKYAEQPTLEMWQALDGLSPKNLDIRAGWHEDCDVLPLDTLRHPWKDLESLSLTDLLCLFQESPAPQVFSQISSLEMVYCCGVHFIPPGGTTKLAHLQIVENDSFSMFCVAFGGNPRLRETLETLNLEGGKYDRPSPDFRRHLKQCTNLRKLRLSITAGDDTGTDLASHIPPSVEHLALRFKRSIPFLHDMNDWIKHAWDKTWLPNLKVFDMSIDTSSPVTGLGETLETSDSENSRIIEAGASTQSSPESFDLEFKQKQEILYDLLKTLEIGSPSPQLSPESFDLEFHKRKKVVSDFLKLTRPSIDVT